MSALRQQRLPAGTGGAGHLGPEQRRVVLHWLGWRRHVTGPEAADLEPFCGEWWNPPWFDSGPCPKPISMRAACRKADIATAGHGFTLGATPYGARATGGVYGHQKLYQIVVRNGTGAQVGCFLQSTDRNGTPASALVAYIDRVRSNYRRPESADAVRQNHD